ncbi:MAG: c-type cytochrome [Burkholderiales bacterium]|nr:c-type cytochrome [Burkholderiales bacterium]
MKRIATALLIAFAAALPAQANGDAARGESKAAMCIGCHGIKGYQASFPEVHRVPMISGQNAGYIVAALQAYAKGERKHPTMKGIAASLTEQDMADLAAYYAGHAGAKAPEQVAEAPAAVKALLDKGVCISCHGANFSKAISDAYPKIAGQHADYLYVALKSYHAEARLGTVGRGNAIMQGQIKGMSNADLKLLAKYLGSLPGELVTVPQSRFR